MCYYNGQKVTHAEFIRLKHMEKLVANYDFLNTDLHDGFAYGKIAVIKPTPDGQDFEIVQMEWGFIPDSWIGRPLDTRAKVEEWRRGYLNPSGVFIKGVTTLNAMGEELLLKGKIYRQSAMERRCLILSSGFFEWHHYHPLNKKTGLPLKTELTIPHYIHPNGQPYFLMAGIYKPWTDVETGEHIDTCSIVTTTAKGQRIMEWVHNTKERMPTILNEELASEWIFGQLPEERVTEIATTQLTWQDMKAYPVEKKFKESVEPTQPFIYPEEVPSLERYLEMVG